MFVKRILNGFTGYIPDDFDKFFIVYKDTGEFVQAEHSSSEAERIKKVLDDHIGREGVYFIYTKDEYRSVLKNKIKDEVEKISPFFKNLSFEDKKNLIEKFSRKYSIVDWRDRKLLIDFLYFKKYNIDEELEKEYTPNLFRIEKALGSLYASLV